VEAAFPVYLEAAEACQVAVVCPVAVACLVAAVVYPEVAEADCRAEGEDCRAEAREAACQARPSLLIVPMF
jgi:hypothetical protein